MNRFACALVGLGLLGGVSRAADPSAELKSAAVDVITVGVELFNGGNQEGCYRLYEGALLALRPSLAGRPELAGVVSDRIARARAAATVRDRAFILREALDALAGAGMAKKPLWDRLGGQPAVEAVVHDFVIAAAPDPKVNFFRNGHFTLDDAGVKRLERRLVELVSAVAGGPLKYTGRDMKNTHQGMKISQSEFNAAAGHLIAALKKFNVPQADIDELVGIIATTAKDMVEVNK